MELAELADRAVSLVQLDPTMKLSAAVAKAVEGRGLSQEGLHRVSTMANRKYLVLDQKSKQSSRTPLWTSRWDTSKPTELSKTSAADAYNTRTTTPDKLDPGDVRTGSMGSAGSGTEDALDYQLYTLREAAREMYGDHEAGYVREGGAEGEDDDEDDQPSSFETVEEFERVDKRSSASGPAGLAPPSYRDRYVPSSEERFAKLAHVIVPPRARTEAEARAKVSQVREGVNTSLSLLHQEYDKALQARDELRELRVKLSFDLVSAKARLDVCVDDAISAGLTVGETMQFVKLAGMHEEVVGQLYDDARTAGWYLEYVKESMPRLGVDPEAVLGNSYNEEGFPKTSHIQAQRALVQIRPQLLPRPEDPQSIEDPDSPLMKASAAYYLAKESAQAADYAYSEALKAVKRMDEGLSEALDIRTRIYKAPDQLIAETF